MLSNRNDIRYFYLQVIPILPIKFRAIGLSIMDNFTLYFQDVIGMILASYFKSTSHPYTNRKFRVIWPFGSGEEGQKDIQYGHSDGHLGFQVNRHFGSGEVDQNRFSR